MTFNVLATAPFQSTLPRGERLACLTCGVAPSIFQSTLPRGERPFPFVISLSTLNFNPRSREGSDQALLCLRFRMPISIHAPARGATCDSSHTQYLIFISIHAPARGATRHAAHTFSMRWISIHAPARGATASGDIITKVADKISIHAPARGATAFIDIFSFTVRLYFISSH